MSPISIVVLASGSGSLLQALIDAQDIKTFTIVRVITDRDCAAVKRARNANIDAQVLTMLPDREEWNRNLAKTITEAPADLIVSAGFMRVVSAAIARQFEGKLINIHPALLPQFPGAHAVRDALNAKVSETGTTVHFIDQGIDTGPVIASRKVPINSTDNEESLHERIKVQERELLVQVVQDFAQGKVKHPQTPSGT